MLRHKRILEQLQSLSPQHLELLNESDSHSGPPGRESHFKLLIVSEKFAGQSRVDRQRMIYQKLESELSSGLHALSIRALSPEEWTKSSSQDFQSPECKK